MTPLRWVEALLVLFLPAKDRETVTGDLLEEYRDAIQAGTSRFRANYRYFRQALSVVATYILTARHLLLTTCLLSIAAAANLAYISNAPEAKPLASVFAAQCALTIAILIRPRRIPGAIIAIGGITVASGGSLALAELALTHFDMKLALTGVAFITQGALTLALQFGCFGGFPQGS